MAKFQIHVVNSDFTTCNEIEASAIGDARSLALRAALEIGTEDVCKGVTFFGAEVRLELDGETKERFLVSMGHSTLQ